MGLLTHYFKIKSFLEREVKVVESTLIEREDKVNAGGLDDVEKNIEECLEFFTEAVEETKNLSIVGTSFNTDQNEVFVIDDSNNQGEHIEVLISEIIEKVRDITIAREFVKIMQTERSPIILNGITRIVGYFSRVNNWNRSKIGELRDRRKGEYSVNGS